MCAYHPAVSPQRMLGSLYGPVPLSLTAATRTEYMNGVSPVNTCCVLPSPVVFTMEVPLL